MGNSPYKVVVIGLGYVGLTLAIALARKGVKVQGVEINKAILKSIKNGSPHFVEHNLDVELQKVTASGLFSAYDKVPEGECNFIIVTVGTPLQEEKKVGFDGLERALDSIPNVKKGGDTCLVLRSTVAVGTSANLAERLGLKGIKNICFAPERTIEGNALEELSTLPQIIGGNSPSAVQACSDLFSILTPKIVRVSSLEIAELAKLFNNTYRDINFALGNYFALVAQRFGADGVEAIEASNRDYKRGGIPIPGLVGGPCLEKDPYILSYGKYAHTDIPILDQFNFTKMGRQFNEQLTTLICERVRRLPENSVLIMSGLAFKGQPETSDLRGSVSLTLYSQLRSERSAPIRLHDFVALPREVEAEFGAPLSELPESGSGHVLMICNNHERYQSLSPDYLSEFELIIDIPCVLQADLKSSGNVINFGSIVG